MSDEALIHQPDDGKDTYIRSSWAMAGHYGVDGDELRVSGWGDHYWSFLRFDLTGLPEAVDSVTLRLYSILDNTGTGRTHPEMSLQTVGGAREGGMRWPDDPTAPGFVADLPAVDGVGWHEIDATDIHDGRQSGARERRPPASLRQRHRQPHRIRQLRASGCEHPPDAPRRSC